MSGTPNGTLIGKLSDYANVLPREEKTRYVEKIKAINFTDPYAATLNSADFPTTVTTGHVIEYLLGQAIPSSGQHVKNMRSIEAYRKFESGFVSTVTGGIINNLFVVRGKVYHSMKLNKSLLTPWIIVKKDGCILSAHCDCVAGVSETCSHVATLLYALANLHFMTSSYKLSVTELPSYWARPAKRIKEDLYHPVKDIDYGFKITRTDDMNIHASRKRFHCFVSSLRSEDAEPVAVKKFCAEGDISCSSCRLNTIPDEICLNSNVLLANQFDPCYEHETFEKIKRACEYISITITEKEVRQVEELTRKQAQSQLWRWVRIGRITASVINECIHASTVNVPTKMSLLKKICHPYRCDFDSEATAYGHKNELKAKNSFKKEFQHHRGVKFLECGTFIFKNQPYLAATPDLIIKCECCGTATVEFKCPFRLSKNSRFNKQLNMSNLAEGANSFLVSDGDTFKMRETHPYFLQVQAQIAITNADYGYFYVWSDIEKLCIKVEKDMHAWENACKKAETYFKNIVLPELLANYYSNSRN